MFAALAAGACILAKTAMIGHIHIAKTGGTTLNEIMANRYNFVCGNKGYSFDYYQANARARGHSRPGQTKDSVGRLYAGYDRTRVPFDIMRERGFENCLWVSLEEEMARWHYFDKWLEPLELHLPCRDPIDHFMSQVNFRGIHLDCTKFQMGHVGNYLVAPERFAIKDIPKNVSVRCIHFHKQFTEYPDVTNLPKKRYFQKLNVLRTNRARKIQNECIWKNHTLQAELKKYLFDNYDYYRFCNTCRDWVV